MSLFCVKKTKNVMMFFLHPNIYCRTIIFFLIVLTLMADTIIIYV